jgi:hypothetical protein
MKKIIKDDNNVLKKPTSQAVCIPIGDLIGIVAKTMIYPAILNTEPLLIRVRHTSHTAEMISPIHHSPHQLRANRNILSIFGMLSKRSIADRKT